MSTTLAFDVYGTLIDTLGVVSKLDEMIGGKAKEFSLTWREKQLEYSFHQGFTKVVHIEDPVVVFNMTAYFDEIFEVASGCSGRQF